MKRKLNSVNKLSDNDLRAHGYMTSEEFVDKLTPGLKEYLSKNWGVKDKKSLHHPEDLISNAAIYMEVAYHVIADFGAGPTG